MGGRAITRDAQPIVAGCPVTDYQVNPVGADSDLRHNFKYRLYLLKWRLRLAAFTGELATQEAQQQMYARERDLLTSRLEGRKE